MARTALHEQESNSRQLLLERIDGGIRELLAEMQQGKSDRLVKYLEFSARFQKYSLHNQFLIYLQCPQATFVAGYRLTLEPLKWYRHISKTKGICLLTLKGVFDIVIYR